MDRNFDGSVEKLPAELFIGCSYVRGFSIVMRLQVAFERCRLRFMESKNPLHFLALLCSVGRYRCYYKSVSGALRVLAGD